MELETGDSPCAVAAFAHLVRGGFWQGQACYRFSTGRFPTMDCGVSDGSARRAGVQFPTEVTRQTRYPTGTVVLSHLGPCSDAGSIQVSYGEVPYPPEFTVLGHVISGLEVIADVVAGGRTGSSEYDPLARPLSITGVDLR